MLESRLTEAHYSCQYVMPTLTAAVARLGFGELWRRTQAQRTVATDCLTERHAANAKTRRERQRGEEEKEGDLNELHVWFQIVQGNAGTGSVHEVI